MRKDKQTQETCTVHVVTVEHLQKSLGHVSVCKQTRKAGMCDCFAACIIMYPGSTKTTVILIFLLISC